MATIKSFEELEIWKLARDLSKAIFKLTGVKHFANDLRFKDQVRSASGSVMDNIAEGFERGGRLEFIQFLSVAKGSCGEIRSQGYRAFDYDYISEKELREIQYRTEELSVKIGNFITYLNKSIIKGSKFKDRKTDRN